MNINIAIDISFYGISSISYIIIKDTIITFSSDDLFPYKLKCKSPKIPTKSNMNYN